ncbi:MAG: PadR family transcriptional regulator [Acidimicrobiales bacterium]|jgi:DNA-binding PadR family transcriptional regulator
MESKFRASPLALAVLGLLEVGPLHPYGIQRLIKQWGKDRVVNVGNRANLYKTIKRLHEAGLIAVLQTERDQQYPERTVYELTEDGRTKSKEWLVGMLSTPRNEFPEFPAALSFAMLLGPEETVAVLERRAELLAEDVATYEHDAETHSGSLPRVTLLDDEYQLAVATAELNWIRGVIEDLRSGLLTWGDELANAARSSLAEAGVTREELGVVQ